MSEAGPLIVVGPGRVGRSVAGALARAARDVVLVGREAGPGRELLERPRLTLLFTVPDDALGGAAAAWAERLDGVPSAEGRVALHTSGADGPEILAPLRDRSFSVAGWHPLVSVAEPAPDALRGVTCVIRGDPDAVERGRRLAEVAGATALALEDVDGARYHAAAVFASNHLVACLAVAAEELAAATDGAGRLEHLLPLARSAVENVASRGLREGLTGPVLRGDVGSVRRHLEELPPRRAALYRELARELLALAGDGVADEARAELEALIGTGRTGRER